MDERQLIHAIMEREDTISHMIEIFNGMEQSGFTSQDYFELIVEEKSKLATLEKKLRRLYKGRE